MVLHERSPCVGEVEVGVLAADLSVGFRPAGFQVFVCAGFFGERRRIFFFLFLLGSGVLVFWCLSRFCFDSAGSLRTFCRQTFGRIPFALTLAFGHDLLAAPVVLKIIVDDIAAIHALDQSDLPQCVKLLHGDVKYEFRSIIVHVTVREIVTAVGKHDDECADGRGHGTAQTAHLTVKVEAVRQLHVAASSHRLISSCDSVVFHPDGFLPWRAAWKAVEVEVRPTAADVRLGHDVQCFRELHQVRWWREKNPDIFHHMLPNRL